MNDRGILRDLSKKVSEIAQLDVQRENAELYRALNRKKPVRPIVLMSEIPWNQLSGLHELKLECEGEFERSVEWNLRRVLYAWNHFRCDMIVSNEYKHPKHIKISSIGMEVLEEIREIDKGNNIVSHFYEDQMADESAILKLREQKITHDEKSDSDDSEKLESLFGDILPIRLTGFEYMGYYAPWDLISRFRGVEPLLYDLADRPEYMHSIMDRMTEINIKLLADAERMNLLEPQPETVHCTAGLADELPEKGPVTRKDIWGRGTAQIFASVSPKMHEEFEIKHVRRFFEGFGLFYYGCCEPLHNKIDILRSFPNLRKISITPWADVDMAADAIGPDYVMAYKPNPSYVATDSLSEDAVKNELSRALNAAKRNNTPIEFTLKDISSVNRHPENLDRWAKIAMSIATE